MSSKINLSDEQKKLLQGIELEMLREFDRVCRIHRIHYCLAYGSLLGAVRHKGFIPWDDDVDICMTRENYNKFQKVANKTLKPEFFFQSHETEKNYMLFYGRLRNKHTVFKETYFADYDIQSGAYLDIFPVDKINADRVSDKLRWTYFRVLRIISNSKYYKIEAREGKKKYFAVAIRALTFFIPIQRLFDLETRLAEKINRSGGNYYINLTSPYGKRDCFPLSYYDKTQSIIFEDNKFETFGKFEKVLQTMYGEYMEFPPPEKRTSVHHLAELDLSFYSDRGKQ